jgi:hypothetical protein
LNLKFSGKLTVAKRHATVSLLEKASPAIPQIILISEAKEIKSKLLKEVLKCLITIWT